MVLTWWKEEYLDLVLVPIGVITMLAYHLLQLHRCIHSPETTVIGYDNHCRRAWVARILQIEPTERGQAISIISSNISAATSLGAISLTLSSLIGVWIGSSYNNEYLTNTIYGNRSSAVAYIKYVSLLSCFVLAFACFVQTTRCFVHANFLISMPSSDTPVRIVEGAVIRGSNFWVVGIRSLYFATNLLLWIFGPIPMFLCSLLMVVLLYYLDRRGGPLPYYGDRSGSGHESFEMIKKKMGEAEENIERGEGLKMSPNGFSRIREE